MPRGRNPNIDEAKKLYKQGNKLIDIAAMLNVPEGTIRSWKNRYNWDEDNATLQKDNKNKRNVANKKRNEKEPISRVVKEVMNNDELNDKHKQFCIIYAKRQNAVKAYQKVYHCTYWTAAVEGCKLLKKPKIKEQINKILEEELNKEYLKKGLIQQYKDIAFSDIGDYIEFGQKRVPQWRKNDDGEMVPVMDPNTGQQMIKEYSYIELKDSVSVDTSLISEVSEGKDGIKFKLADKMKAMDVLAKLSNLLSDEEKTKLDIEYMRLRNNKIDIENKKATGEDLEIEDTEELEDEIYGGN